MGAMKAYAIELEQAAEDSGSKHSFIMGMLAAASLLIDVRGQYTRRVDERGSGAWDGISEAINACLDASGYLSDTF